MTARIAEGQVVEGSVTSVVSFGVFVAVGEGVEGLVHTSEMAGIDPETLQRGDRVMVEVLQIDHSQRQIALRMVATIEAPEEPDADEGDTLAEGDEFADGDDFAASDDWAEDEAPGPDEA
ncbi:MAG: S1 RNA-binding domain-containing protein [Chloroflexi bacterium]|nr:S1 RNA-binding domain-containing protein [Chloroflexota bacterium]